MRAMKDSGVEWLGEVPAAWGMARIGAHFCEIKEKNKGGSVNALKFYAGTIVEKNLSIITDADIHVFSGYTCVLPGDEVINCLNLNFDLKSERVGLVEEAGIITSAYLVIRQDGSFDSRFCNYALKAYDFRKAFHNMGTGIRKTLNWAELKQHRIPVPSLEEQGRIADFLDEKCNQIDCAITAAEQSIEEYKAYRVSLVTSCVENESFPTKRFKAIATVVTNLVSPNDYPELTEIDPENIEKYTGRLIGLRSVYEVGVISTKNYFHKGQILYSKIRPLLNKVAIAPCDGLCSTDMYPIETSQDARWLRYAMTSDLFVRQIALECSGVKMPRINVAQLGSTTFRVPSLEEQGRIADFLDEKCDQIDRAVEAKQAIIDELKAYKKSLIYEVVTGKREV